MMTRRFSLTAIAAAAMFSGAAHAATAPLTGQQILQQFNQVSLGDAKSSSETIGRAWIGGNVNKGQYAMSTALPESNYAGLTVIGSTQSTIHVKNGGLFVKGSFNGDGSVSGAGASYVGGNSIGVNYDNQAQIVGSLAGNLNKGGQAGSLADSGSHVNGGGLTQASIDYIAKTKAASESTVFKTVLDNTSASLSKLTGNSIVTIGEQGVTFNAQPTNGVAVFDLTQLVYPTIAGSSLQFDDAVFGARSIKFNLNGATTVIINSDNATINSSANFFDATTIGAKLLWNLYDADNVTFGTQWGGSVLASGATFTNYNTIEGSVYAASFDQHSEIHQVMFTGTLPVAAVPEPETYAMLLGGLGLMGFIARRRKQAAAR